MARKEPTGWVGWLAFASFMMILAGIFGAVEGLTAIFHDTFFAVTKNYLITINVTAWGWIHFILGLVVVAAGFALLSGKMWARAVAILLAVISAVVNMVYIPYYPVWSLLVIVIDVLVIYAVVARGRELED